MLIHNYNKEKLVAHSLWLKSMSKQELTEFYVEDTLSLLGESIEHLQRAGIAIHNEEILIEDGRQVFELGVSWRTNKILMIRYHFIVDIYEVGYCDIRGWTPEMNIDDQDGEPLQCITLQHHNPIFCDELHSLFVKYSTLRINPPNPALCSAPHRLHAFP